MKKRKYSQIVACLLSATLASSFICSSIVFASETTSAKIQELNESTVSIENKKEDTETVNPMGDSQVKTTASSNQEANEIQLFAENNNAGDFNVIGDTSGWTYDDSDNTLTVTASGTYTITGDGVATTERIIVSGNSIDATIILNNVNIDVSATNSTIAFLAKDINQSNVKLVIVLQGTNILKSGIIWNNSDNDSSLEIKGKGSLMAIGESGGAAIGGSWQPASNITISGGVITATGGNGGAGIGGGFGQSGTNITINDGTVIATGENGGTGIGGGGNGGVGRNIVINSGMVTAIGGLNGAGIGGRGDGSNIIINGGTVTATGGGGGAGIGGRLLSATSNIKITGGSVKASSIGTTPTDGNGNNVYLAKLDNLSGVNSVSVDGTNTYTRKGDHPDNDGAFYLYLTGNNRTIQTSNGEYIANWNGSNGFTVQQPTPKPIFTTSQTANSITVKPTNYKADYGTIEYKWDNEEWGTSDTLLKLKASSSHTVSIRYAENDSYRQSEEATQTVTTNNVSYKISIPATPLIAGNTESTAEISINGSQSFDLSYNGQVDIKIADNGNVTSDAKLKLNGTTRPQTEITSALLVNGKALGNINNNVAEFTMSNKEPVSVSFAKPTEKNILAGTYTGTITFEVSYSEQ